MVWTATKTTLATAACFDTNGSGGDRHGFAVSQCLDIANWGPAKESPVLAIELARAFIADLERRTCRIQFTREHVLHSIIAPATGTADKRAVYVPMPRF
jgi:hypothetical protein